MHGKKWSSWEITRLKVMKLDGLPNKEIAKKLGRSYGSVMAQIRYLTLFDDTYTSIRVNHKWDSEERQKAQEMYDSGIAASTIGLKLGCSASAVYNQVVPRKKACPQ